MTGTLKARVGGVWVPILGSGQEAAATARWNSAWGVIGSASMTASHTGITSSANPGTVINNSTVTVTTVAGRRYRISYNPLPYCDTANELVIIAITYDGTIVYSSAITVPNTGNSQGIFLEYFHAPTAGTHTYAASAWRGSTASNINFGAAVNQPTTMAVEDVGPVTPASIAPPTAGPRVVASGNALGIVAMGSLLPNPAIPSNTYGNVTNPLNVYWSVGRRYRVAVGLRAVTGSAASGLNTSLVNNGVAVIEKWLNYTGGYEAIEYEWIFDGDDANHTLNVQLKMASASISTFTEVGYWYCEDMGPNTYPALPIPATPPAWTPLPLINGWTPYGADRAPAYRKMGDMVQLRGLAKGPGSSVAFAQLPVGFRTPLYDQCWVCATDGTTPKQVELLSTGVLNVATTSQFVFLDPIYFSTTA